MKTHFIDFAKVFAILLGSIKKAQISKIQNIFILKAMIILVKIRNEIL